MRTMFLTIFEIFDPQWSTCHTWALFSILAGLFMIWRDSQSKYLLVSRVICTLVENKDFQRVDIVKYFVAPCVLPFYQLNLIKVTINYSN